MGKPHVPYQTKRLIDACLESLWDFEVLQGPLSLQLSMTDSQHRIDCRWKKSSDLDTGGRETTRYKSEYMTVYPSMGHPTRATIDEIENIIRTTFRIGKQSDYAKTEFGNSSKRERNDGGTRGNVSLATPANWPWADVPVLASPLGMQRETLF